MPLDFEIPDRCLIAQAANFVAFGRPPIPDDIYLSAPDYLGTSKELTRALRANLIVARGDLHEAYRLASPFGSFRDWKLFSSWPLIDEVKIEPKLWSHENVDFAESKLLCNEAAIEIIYKVDSLDPDALRDSYKDRFSPDADIETAFIFSRITLSTEELLRIFPIRTTDSREPTATPRIQPQSRSGRPPKYPWDEFFSEVIVRADLDGLPEKQSDLVSQMAQWCLDNWGDQPAESVLKERTAAIYKHIRKSKKQSPKSD